MSAIRSSGANQPSPIIKSYYPQFRGTAGVASWNLYLIAFIGGALLDACRPPARKTSFNQFRVDLNRPQAFASGFELTRSQISCQRGLVPSTHKQEPVASGYIGTGDIEK
jgi:hypothetical protein